MNVKTKFRKNITPISGRRLRKSKISQSSSYHNTNIMKLDKYLLPSRRSGNLYVSEDCMYPGEKRLLTFQTALAEKEFSSGSRIWHPCNSFLKNNVVSPCPLSYRNHWHSAKCWLTLENSKLEPRWPYWNALSFPAILPAWLVITILLRAGSSFSISLIPFLFNPDSEFPEYVMLISKESWMNRDVRDLAGSLCFFSCATTGSTLPKSFLMSNISERDQMTQFPQFL